MVTIDDDQLKSILNEKRIRLDYPRITSESLLIGNWDHGLLCADSAKCHFGTNKPETMVISTKEITFIESTCMGTWPPMYCNKVRTWENLKSLCTEKEMDGGAKTWKLTGSSVVWLWLRMGQGIGGLSKALIMVEMSCEAP